MPVFFISYKRENLTFAKEVKRQLESQGLLAWLDDDSMLGGDEWKQVIDNAIKECIAVIVVVTPEALGSQYVTYEWAFALGCGKRVIPIIREFPDPNNPDHPKMHPRLDDKQYRDFTDPDDDSWNRLIRELQVISARKYFPPDVQEAKKRLSDPSSTTRSEAIDWLLTYDDQEKVIGIFVEGAQSKSPEVRMDCALALAQLDPLDARAIPGLVLTATRGNRRQFALGVLSEMNSEEAIAALEQLFDDPKNESWRTEIARAMSKITNPSIVPILIRVTEYVLLQDVFQALGRFGDPRALPVFRRIVEKRGTISHEAKRWAIEALVKINDPGIPDLFVAIFEKFLPDPSASENNAVCSTVIQESTNLGREVALTTLLRMRDADARSMGYYNLALRDKIELVTSGRPIAHS
jgi:hypothetical protein